MDYNKELRNTLLRKDLVRRFIYYYQFLQNEEKLEFAQGKSRSFAPVDFDPLVTYTQFDDELRFYDNMVTRRAKIEELRALMKIELLYIRDGLKLDPESQDFENSTKGYPSFMKTWLGTSEFSFKYVSSGTEYKCGRGPSQFRVFLANLLEKLVAGTENDEDLMELDSFLVHLYIEKNPKQNVINETEHNQMDYHQRMSKEIRRKQYAAGVKAGPQSPDRKYLSLSKIKNELNENHWSSQKKSKSCLVLKHFTRKVTGGEGLNKRLLRKNTLNKKNGRFYQKDYKDRKNINGNKKYMDVLDRADPIKHTGYVLDLDQKPVSKFRNDFKHDYAEMHKTYGNSFKYSKNLNEFKPSFQKNHLRCSTVDYSSWRKPKDNKTYTEVISLNKSPNDQKNYSMVKINSNNMYVLCISDPNTESSCNVVKVKTGSYQDPKEFVGLANLLERMIFLGSKNFTDPQDFDDFFTINGGTNNSFTSNTDTFYS